jgi:hypothetical protein
VGVERHSVCRASADCAAAPTRKPRAHEQGCQQHQRQAQSPFQGFHQRAAGQGAGSGLRRSHHGFARRQQDAGHADPHQGRHHGIGEFPAEGLGQKQRHGTRHDHGEAIAPLIRGRHGPVTTLVHGLDAPGVDHDVLTRTCETHQRCQRTDLPQLQLRIGAGNRPEAQHHDELGQQHPGTARAQQRFEHGQAHTVNHGRPDKLQRVAERGQGEDGNGLQREPGLAQPDGERVEDEQERQAGGKAQQQHDQHPALAIDRQRAQGIGGAFVQGGRGVTHQGWVLRRRARRRAGRVNRGNC